MSDIKKCNCGNLLSKKRIKKGIEQCPICERKEDAALEDWEHELLGDDYFALEGQDIGCK